MISLDKLTKNKASVIGSVGRGLIALRKKQILIPFLGFFIMYILYGFLLSKTVIPLIIGTSSPTTLIELVDVLVAAAGFLIITLISSFLGGLIIDFYAKKNGSLFDGVAYIIGRLPTLFVVVLITGVSTLIGFFLFVIPGAFLGTKFLFAQQEVVIHRKGVIDSIRESWYSSRNKFWSQFSLFFIALLISALAYALSYFSSGTGAIITYLGTQLILPLDVLVSFVLAYSAVFGSAAVTDYFLQRKI